MLSDTTQGHSRSNLSSSSEKTAHDGAVSSNESTVLDNYPNNLKKQREKQIQSIIYHLVKKTRYKSADASVRSSKIPTVELRLDAALGNKKNSLPLDKTERREDAVSDPVDTTNKDSLTSASSNVVDGDLNEACDLSQNQSKCGFLFYF